MKFQHLKTESMDAIKMEIVVCGLAWKNENKNKLQIYFGIKYMQLLKSCEEFGNVMSCDVVISYKSHEN